MTINELVDGLVGVLQAVASTQMAQAKVYKGDQRGARGPREISVVWLGAGESHGFNNEFSDEHRVMLIARMPCADPAETSPTAPGTWYGYFLDLCQELRDAVTTVATRTLTAGGEQFQRLEITGDECGYDAGQGADEMWMYTVTLTVQAPQD